MDPVRSQATWLTLRLLEALCRRPDLQLSGRNLYDPLAPRIPIQWDILQAACERDNRDDAIYRRWVHLSFRENHAATGHDVPRTHMNPAQPLHLMDVRIEAASAAAAASTTAEAGRQVKMAYNPARCRAWFRLRIDGWPEDRPPPNRDDCYDAARAYFGGPIDRAEFRQIRTNLVPLPWKARGRRSVRNTAAP